MSTHGDVKVLSTGKKCRGEKEMYSKGDLLEYLLDESGEKEHLYQTKPGALSKRMTSYAYVKALF